MGHKQNKSAGRVVYEAQNLDNYKGLKNSLNKSDALQTTYTKDQKKPGLLNEENLLDE
mgnify:CR=1